MEEHNMTKYGTRARWPSPAFSRLQRDQLRRRNGAAIAVTIGVRAWHRGRRRRQRALIGSAVAARPYYGGYYAAGLRIRWTELRLLRGAGRRALRYAPIYATPRPNCGTYTATAAAAATAEAPRYGRRRR